MTYGKNQQALLDFLHKHPNQWHRIKGRKSIDAAKRLHRRGIVLTVRVTDFNNNIHTSLMIPQMLMEQN